MYTANKDYRVFLFPSERRALQRLMIAAMIYDVSNNSNSLEDIISNGYTGVVNLEDEALYDDYVAEYNRKPTVKNNEIRLYSRNELNTIYTNKFDSFVCRVVEFSEGDTEQLDDVYNWLEGLKIDVNNASNRELFSAMEIINITAVNM